MRKLAAFAPATEATPLLKSLVHDENPDVRSTALELYSRKASKEEVSAEMIRILEDDQSDAMKALAVEELRRTGKYDHDLFDKVRGSLSSSDMELKMATARYMLFHVSKIGTEEEREGTRTEIFSALRQVTLAAKPGGENLKKTKRSGKVTSIPVSPSESGALEAMALYINGSTDSLAEFLAPLASSSSGAVRKYAIIEMIREKSLDSVPLASSELKAVEEKETVFQGALFSALSKSFKMPARIRTESKDRTPSEVADLIDDWWNDVKADFEQEQQEKQEQQTEE